MSNNESINKDPVFFSMASLEVPFKRQEDIEDLKSNNGSESEKKYNNYLYFIDSESEIGNVVNELDAIICTTSSNINELKERLTIILPINYEEPKFIENESGFSSPLAKELDSYFQRICKILDTINFILDNLTI